MGVGRQTALRPATDEDVDLLVAWHADPEVSRFWDEEIYTPETMREYLADKQFVPWIVEEEGQPVGFLQHWWDGEDARTVGLDGFLIPSARGRRIMPTVARRLAEQLLDDGWESVTVDPYAWNEQGVRGWANAGFVEVSRHPADDEHTAEWVLMRFEPRRALDVP
jgi:aminoglycoside 6'-N-acetyltransferase